MKNFIYLSLSFMLLTSFTADQKSVEQNNLKVDVCHKGNAISVNGTSLISHLLHGDILGNCDPCNSSSLDTDNDGVPDCFDPCPNTPGCPETGCPPALGTGGTCE
jgi:hypothetical protein